MIKISRENKGFKMMVGGEYPEERAKRVHARSVDEAKFVIEHYYGGSSSASNTDHAFGRLKDCPLCRKMT